MGADAESKIEELKIKLVETTHKIGRRFNIFFNFGPENHQNPIVKTIFPRNNRKNVFALGGPEGGGES